MTRIAVHGTFRGTANPLVHLGFLLSLPPYETAPAGNAVVLEEQMAKINETQVSHSVATGLYRKHLAMLKTATGPR